MAIGSMWVHETFTDSGCCHVIPLREGWSFIALRELGEQFGLEVSGGAARLPLNHAVHTPDLLLRGFWDMKRLREV